MEQHARHALLRQIDRQRFVDDVQRAFASPVRVTDKEWSGDTWFMSRVYYAKYDTVCEIRT